MKVTNQGVASAMIVGLLPAVVYIVNSDWAFEQVSDGFMLGSFPLFYLSLAIVFLLITAFGRNRHAELNEFSKVSIAGALRLAAFVAACLIFALLHETVGYIACITLILLVTHFVMGQRSVFVLVTFPLSLSVLSYLLFTLLGVNLTPIPDLDWLVSK